MQIIRCNNCLGYGHDTYSCSTVNPLAQISHALQPRILAQNPVMNAAPRNIHFDNSRDSRNLATPRNAELICRYCKIPRHSLEQEIV